MNVSTNRFSASLFALLVLSACSTPHKQNRGPECTSGSTQSVCRQASTPAPVEALAPVQTPEQLQSIESQALGKHFMIQVSNYQALSANNKQNRLFLYAFATNPALGIGQYSPPDCRSWNRAAAASAASGNAGQGIERFINPLKNAKDGVVAKMLIFSSVATAELYLARTDFVADLKSGGIAWVGYNMEGDKTPPYEMCSVRGGSDASGNAVSRFARAARQAGFKFIWGPIRNDLDKISDAMVTGMCSAGMSGIAMQEQNTIEAGVDTRINAVQQTIKRYRQLCGQDFYATVQVMSRSCGADSCNQFASGFVQETQSLAIWATGSEISKLNSLMDALSGLMQ